MVYEFAEAGAVEVLEDVKETVHEQGVILDELLGSLAGSEGTELRVDGVVPLGRHGWRGGQRRESAEAETVGAARRVIARAAAMHGAINAMRGSLQIGDGELGSVWSVCTGLRGTSRWACECDRR